MMAHALQLAAGDTTSKHWASRCDSALPHGSILVDTAGLETWLALMCVLKLQRKSNKVGASSWIRRLRVAAATSARFGMLAAPCQSSKSLFG